jgi:membrane-bound serine protease (ClpP class)
MRNTKCGLKVVLHAFTVFAALALLPGSSVIAAPASQVAAPQVIVLHLNDTIQPISQDYLLRGLKRAADIHADAVLVMMNTPGGLLDSTRQMVAAILASPTPVILYVAPTGSRAGSAGFFLLEAADIAAMAPGTNAGAAHPVLEGQTLDPIMKQKLENDATAFLRSYVSRRGRNTDAAQDAVLNSKSYTEREAQQLHLIDIISPDEHALLNDLDGRSVTRFDGRTQTLHTRDAALTEIPLTLREQILDRLMDPNLAVLILMIGGLLIYLEFNTPGTIIPGALGTLLLLVALFALNLLPVHYTSVVLILGAFVLMLLEAKIPSHGVLAGVGIIALVLGTMTLVDAPIPELRVHVATAIATGVAFGFITTFLVRLAIRARRNKVLIGADALVGNIGTAQEQLTPRGQILVHGELWFAESATPVAAGEHVRVRSVRGMTLLVERIPESVSAAL